MPIKQFIIPKTWRISTTSDLLVLSGGADLVYELDIVDNPNTSFKKIKNNPYRLSDLSEQDKITHEQLVTAGIAVPKLAKKPILKYKVFGDYDIQIDIKNTRISKTDDYDLGIIIRSTQTLAELLQEIDYQSIQKPHILFDVSFYQNISIGPLVFPGDTACLACLQGRLEYRWGDPKPSKTPRVYKNSKLLLCALIEKEIERFINQDYMLIGKTISLDIDTYQNVKHPLYKIEFCPVCTKPTVDRLKRLT